MKKIIIFLIIVIIAIVLIVIGARNSSPLSENSNVISTNGIHWHPQLHIYVQGNEVDIPKDIGLIGQHSPVHTHDDLPNIHLEFEGLVTTEDITLGKFFKVWNKDLYEFGDTLTMKVNGESNSLLGNYIMQDGDIIELYYE